MGFSAENGYVPGTVQDIMLAIMDGINTQFGTTYTTDTFIGTGFYKNFYALAQKVQANEIKTSEIFLYLQDYFNETNEKISRPVVTVPGLVGKFALEGWTASLKKMIEADAGKINLCVDVDEAGEDYAAEKLEICTLIKDSTAAGTVSLGTESEAIVLSNGQSFDFKFHLPDRIETLLRLTITVSENNMFLILPPEETIQILRDNIAARYALGKNFEPQKYFSTADAPWASQVLLEWSINDGSDYFSTVFDSEFDELLEITLENIELIEV